jgi:hypothetical protein
MKPEAPLERAARRHCVPRKTRLATLTRTAVTIFSVMEEASARGLHKPAPRSVKVVSMLTVAKTSFAGKADSAKSPLTREQVAPPEQGEPLQQEASRKLGAPPARAEAQPAFLNQFRLPSDMYPRR